MSLQERIDSMVEKIRAVWGIVMSVALIWVIAYHPLWWLIPLALVGVISYFLVLVAAGYYLSATISIDEIRQQILEDEAFLASQGIHLDPEGEAPAGVIEGEVIDKSPVIGKFGAIDIHDWIIIQVAGEAQRFTFEMVTPTDAAGNLIFPDEPDRAIYNGLIYKLSST